MTFDEYFRRYPEGIKYRAYLFDHASKESDLKTSEPGLLSCGMLQFSPESAPYLGGPFPGGCAVFTLKDTRKIRVPRRGKDGLYLKGRTWSLAASGSHAAGQHPNEPWAQPGQSASMQFPIKLYIAGNDDDSWSHYYASRWEARKALQRLENQQPLDLHSHLLDYGFIYTN